MKSFRVIAAGLGVVVLWASAFPAIRVAAPALGVAGLSFVRLTAAAVTLLAVAPFAHVRPPQRRHAVLLAAAAFFGMTAYQVLLNAGELHVPAGTASIVVSSAPMVSVAIATLALGERLTQAKIAGSLVAIAGVAVVCLSRSGATFTTAIWVVVGAAVVQGIYHPLTKRLLETRSGLEVATYAVVAGALMALPLLPWGWDRLVAAPASAWGSALFLALAPSALGFVLWGYAVANLPVASSTSLLYLVPAVAVLIAFVWLGEVPHASELLGGVVVIAGVVLVGQGDRLQAQLRRRRDPHRIERPSIIRGRHRVKRGRRAVAPSAAASEHPESPPTARPLPRDTESGRASTPSSGPGCSRARRADETTTLRAVPPTTATRVLPADRGSATRRRQRVRAGARHALCRARVSDLHSAEPAFGLIPGGGAAHHLARLIDCPPSAREPTRPASRASSGPSPSQPPSSRSRPRRPNRATGEHPAGRRIPHRDPRPARHPRPISPPTTKPRSETPMTIQPPKLEDLARTHDAPVAALNAYDPDARVAPSAPDAVHAVFSTGPHGDLSSDDARELEVILAGARRHVLDFVRDCSRPQLHLTPWFTHPQPRARAVLPQHRSSPLKTVAA
jgi:drug/metabolite transporter (DMT)-like permease